MTLVWSEPMMHLARRYGLSDVGLAKICRKCDIPRPPRGYWAQKQVGKAPRQTQLPHPEEELRIELRDPNDCRIVSTELQDEVVQKITEEKQIESKIEVADNLHGSHPLVRQANQKLQTAKTNENGLIILPEEAALHIRVSKGCLRRSLLIMDALLKGLEQRGYQISKGPTVEILGVAVRFEISEPLQTVREESDETDFNGSYSFMHSRFTKRLSPSGKLTLRIDGWADGCRQTWRDGGKSPLEDRLNSVVVGLIKFAAREKERQVEREKKAQAERETQQRRQEEAKLRAEKRTLIKAEHDRVNALIEKSTQWQQSQNLRHYIEAEKKKHLTCHEALDPESEFSRWCEWAVQQADRLDPLVESPPSILDEVVPDEPEEPRSWWNR